MYYDVPFFTFLSDRLVYIILRGQIDTKHQCKTFFLKILLSWYFAGGQIFFRGGSKAQISHISKSIALRIKIFSPIDSATPVSYLSAMHNVGLTPLFYELFIETVLHVLHAGVSWLNHVRYPLHAPKLRLSEPVHTAAAWYCCIITEPPTVPISRFSCQGLGLLEKVLKVEFHWKVEAWMIRQWTSANLQQKWKVMFCQQ